MKIDSLNLNSSKSNMLKANAKSTNSYNSFDSLFAKATYSSSVNNQDNKNQDNNTKELAQVSQQTSKYDDNYRQNDTVKNRDVSEDDSLKPVPKEVKDALKKAGMSDEEVDKINSLKDLKDKVDPNKLLSILLSLINGNFTNQDLSNIKDKIGEQIKSIINEEPTKYANASDEAQLKNKLINGLFDKVSGDANGSLVMNTKDSKIPTELTAAINGKLKVNEQNSKIQSLDMETTTKNTDTKVTNDDILSKVQSELDAALKDCLRDLKANKEEMNDLKVIPKNLSGKGTEEIIKSVNDEDKTSDDSSLLNSNSSKGDDGFLKNLLSDGNDKISRVTNFMSQFNNMKVDSNAISDLEKVVINKNTVGTDMIKALKYMQTNNKTDLIVKINPKELGEVIIKITMDSGVMKASISAANKEAYNLLNSNLSDMTNKLQNNDIKIQNLSLNLYNEDTTFFKDGSDKNRNGSEQKGKKAETIGAIGEDENGIVNQSEDDSNVNILA